MIKELIYLLILAAGVLTGLVLAKTCKEEIKAWRKRLFIISIISFIISVIISFIPFYIFEYKFPVMISLFFITIIFLTIIWKSHD